MEGIMSECCASGSEPLVFACSGGSNVGQLSNEAAKTLDFNKEAKMSCMAGLGGHISGMVASAKSGVPILIIDGCSVACGKKIAEHLGLQNFGYVDITRLGIEKDHNISKTPPHQIEEVVNAARNELKKIPSKVSDSGGSCCS